MLAAPSTPERSTQANLNHRPTLASPRSWTQARRHKKMQAVSPTPNPALNRTRSRPTSLSPPPTKSPRTSPASSTATATTGAIARTKAFAPRTAGSIRIVRPAMSVMRWAVVSRRPRSKFPRGAFASRRQRPADRRGRFSSLALSRGRCVAAVVDRFRTPTRRPWPRSRRPPRRTP